MTHHIPSSSHRNLRTFIASFLLYVLLTSQLAPMAMASASANRGAPAKRPIERKITSEVAPEGRSAGSFAPVPMPLRVTAAGMAPIITATKVDSFPDPDGDGKVSPGQTITYSVTLTNTGPDPALNLTLTDTVDPNTTIVGGSAVSTPIAFDDAYNVVGNVRIQPNAAQGLLANDNNPNTGNNTGLTASGGTTSTQGGNVAINSDGSFSYDPPVGFTGTDTFTYTTTSANGTDTATVTLTVAGMIFFVDDDDPTPGGDGRLTNPFNCLVGAGCFTDSTADEGGDNIFLFNGAYTGGLTPLANQKLIGQGATNTLTNISGVGAVQPYSDPLPVTNGNPNNVAITTALPGTNALTVNAGGIILRGFTVGNTTGAKILGSGFGTLTAGNNTLPDLVLSGTGQALSLSSGTFAATSGFASVATTSSAAQGISLSGVAGTVSFGSTTVSGSTTQGVLVGTTTADINFGNTFVSGGTDGVSLQNNATGTRTFGTLSVSNNSGAGFLHAVGGGNVNVTGLTSIPAASQTAPVGTGIDIQSLAGGTTVTFAATTVNKGNAGTGVNLGGVATGNTGNVTFNSLAITCANGSGLVGTGNTGQINVTTSAGSISSTSGPAINITKAAAPASPISLNFGSVSSTDSGTIGVNIDRVSGNLTTGSTSISNPTGVGIQVQNTSAGGTMNFGNTTNNLAGGTGVILGGATSGNAGAITFVTLQIAPDSGQRGLLAQNNTGTISSTNGAINSTGHVAIEITGASAAARTPLSMTLDDIVSINSATLGVNLNFVSGNLTVTGSGTDTDVQNPAGVGIQVLNSGAGTINFGDTSVTQSGGTGVVLGTASNGNTGNVTFTDLDITPDSGQRGLHAVQNTGTVTTGSGTLSTTNAIAVEMVGISSANRAPLNVQLTSVSALASGGNPANGIVLTSTSATGSPGGFRVLGNGGTCTFATPTCTGGRIQSTTGGEDATPEDNAGIGVRLFNANQVFLTRMRIDNHPNFAIHGTNVIGFNLDTSVIDGTNGNNAAFEEGAIGLRELTGTTGAGTASSITNSFIGGGHEFLIDLRNFNVGTLDRLTVNNNTIGDLDGAGGGFGVHPTSGDDALHFEGFGSNTTFNVTVTNNILNSGRGDIVNFNVGTGGNTNLTSDFVMRNNTIQNGHPTILSGGGGTTVTMGGGATINSTYDISCNKFTGARGHGLLVAKTLGAGTAQGTIFNNRIGADGTPGSSSTEASGINVDSRGSGTHNVLIKNNQVHEWGANGAIQIFNNQGSVTMNATVVGNLTNNPHPVNALAGLYAEVGALAGDTSILNILVGGAGAAENNFVEGDPFNGNDVLLSRIAGAGTQHNLSRGVSAASNVPQIITDNNVDPVVGAAAGTINFVNTVPTLPPAINEACSPPAAPETTIGENPGSGDDPVSPTEVAQSTTPSNTDSITSRPFISSPRQQPAVQGGAAAAQGVLRPRPAPAPGPAPIQPPTNIDEPPSPQPPVIMGDTLTWNVGTLPAGQSVTITFQVVVDDPFTGALPQVSNQGTVTADGGISVLTDDPDVPGINNPTVTLVTVPPDLFVRDASVAEPSSGSTPMIFTLALSTPAPTGGITVNLSTANGTATGGTCLAGDDYESVSGGTATFASGEQIKTFPVTVCSDGTAEGDETFTLNVDSAPGTVIVDGTGQGTITANVPGTILISELRSSGPGGAGDDFVEIYNNTDTAHTVPAGGYGLFKSGADCNALPVLVGTIPAATVIPARGHYLFVGSTYSLTSYAGGDATLTTDIESDFNVGLFTTVDPLQVSTANRLDAVGFGISTVGICALLLEGTTLQPAQGSTSEYSFVREFTLVGNDVPTPTDGNDNAADFTVVSTTPSTPVGSNAAPKLGAPSPENLASPNLKKFSQVGALLLDQTQTASGSRNRARDLTPVTNGAQGTLSIRRRFTNNTGAPISRLRFRIYDITTFPVPVGTADLRALTSINVSVAGVMDAANCTANGTPGTPPCTVTAFGTTLDTPPAQPNGGGLNSSMAAGTITIGTPLASGASMNFQFLFGVQQGGTFRVFVFVEALP